MSHCFTFEQDYDTDDSLDLDFGETGSERLSRRRLERDTRRSDRARRAYTAKRVASATATELAAANKLQLWAALALDRYHRNQGLLWVSQNQPTCYNCLRLQYFCVGCLEDFEDQEAIRDFEYHENLRN